MALPHRSRGVKVLKAVSSPLRLQILNLLYDKDALSYTELMTTLKMNPSRDAGRFAYHLKFLLKANLVEADTEAKKYYLTDLGKMLIDVADHVEKNAVRSRGLLVRTSNPSMEEFDANKIANALIREAKVPSELAQKTTKEAEKRLLKAKVKYMTAPLIREFVNALLLENGFEDYRHKLTRVGLPVHEAATLIESREHTQPADDVIAFAGQTVFREYTLLNVFPRDVADAHISGLIHVNGLSAFLLKPDTLLHDLRFFLQNGLRMDCVSPSRISTRPPESLNSALSTALNVLTYSAREVGGQTFDCFNVFLAPYIKGLDTARLKESLRRFLLDVNQHAEVTFGLELTAPLFVAEKAAVGPAGKTCGRYVDFKEESLRLADCMLDVLLEEEVAKPMFNPKVVVKVHAETLADAQAAETLLKAHSVAIKGGVVYFANMLHQEGMYAAYSDLGFKLTANPADEWETETLRSGCVGSVTLNLPRSVQECEGDKLKFFESLKTQVDLAARALEIKQRVLRQYGKNTHPFTMQSTNGDAYFRLEKGLSILNLAGFREAVEAFCQRPASHVESVKFAAEIVDTLQGYIHRMGRRHLKRFHLALLPAREAGERLAQLDVEKYGLARVKFSGTRERPYYSTARRVHVLKGTFLSLAAEDLEMQHKLNGLSEGGNLTVAELGEVEVDAGDLLKLTRNFFENRQVEFLTYNRVVTYCRNCMRSWIGQLSKCPSCESISPIVLFDRFRSV